MNSITTFHKGSDPKDNAMFDRRNRLVLKLLLANSLNNIRLIGNSESPVIVYNDEIRLACYVNGYNLILRDSWRNDIIIGTVALNTKRVVDAESLILDFLHSSEHSSIYRVALTSVPQLFLCGYNYLDRNKKQGKEPVFSKLEGRIYLTLESAQEVVDTLSTYPLEII